MPGGLFGLKRNVVHFFVGSGGSDLSRGVYVFDIDRDNGEILKKKYYKSTANPSYMTRQERWIYCCYKNNTGRETDGGVWQYAAMDVQFGLSARVHNAGKSYEMCFITHDQSCLYGADYYNGEVAVVPIKKLKIIDVVATMKHEGHSIDPKKQTKPHPIYITDTPDHSYLIVCDLGTDELVFYNFLEKGRLERNDELTFKVRPGNGPRKLIFTKDGRYGYLLNEIANTVEVYEYLGEGHMRLIQTVDTFPKDEFSGFSAAGDITMMDNEDYLFVSNKGHDSVASFKINKNNGQLIYMDFVDTDENPSVITCIEDKWFVVGAQKGGTLESWEIRENDRHGVLFETGYNYSIAEPMTIVVSRGF